MKGVPLRIEVGPRDLAKGECVLTKRVNGEKSVSKLDPRHCPQEIPAFLQGDPRSDVSKAKAFLIRISTKPRRLKNSMRPSTKAASSRWRSAAKKNANSRSKNSPMAAPPAASPKIKEISPLSSRGEEGFSKCPICGEDCATIVALTSPRRILGVILLMVSSSLSLALVYGMFILLVKGRKNTLMLFLGLSIQGLILLLDGIYLIQVFSTFQSGVGSRLL
jgi:hypothetical protein